MRDAPIATPLPGYPHIGDRPSAGWAADVVDNLAALRGSQRIGQPQRRYFDLYSMMPFRVYMDSETTVGVSAGRVFVHANSSSPFSCAAVTGLALSTSESTEQIAVKLEWITSIVSIGVIAPSSPLVSDETSLYWPLATVTRYGDGTTPTPYLFSITTIHHAGDIHICGNTGTITAGHGIGFRSTLTGDPAWI